MTAIKIYIEQYHLLKSDLEEYKINFLKNHFYNKINQVLKCNFNDFKIGVSNNNDILWFIDQKNPSLEIIYNHKKEQYFKRYKYIDKNKLELLDLSLESEEETSYHSVNSVITPNTTNHEHIITIDETSVIKEKNPNCINSCTIY